MAVQLQFAPNYAVDTGEFAAGARATFFLSGTTTPVTVYSDEALTVPHDSPLLADASGRFPTVWSEDATNVKVVVTDAGGSALYTQDKAVLGNIAVGNAASVSFAPQANNPSTNVQTAIEFNSDNKANIASPAFTGTPTAPNPASGDSSTRVATTQWVRESAVGNTIGPLSAVAAGSVQATGIPSWATQVDILLSGVSRVSAVNLSVRLIDTATVTTGYISTGSFVSGTNVQASTSTLGLQQFIVLVPTWPSNLYGTMTLTKGDGNVWFQSHSIIGQSGSTMMTGAGQVTLSSALTGVQVGASGGLNGGSFVVRYW